MVDKITLELPADTIGGDILVSTETRERAEAAATRAEQARDQAEVFAAGTVELQDAAMTLVAANAASTFYGQMASEFALKGEIPSDVVLSQQVGRMIAIPENAELPPLLDGDLVIRYAIPGNVYYKDFSTDTVDTEPSGMTRLSSKAAEVKTTPGAIGGKALQFTAGGPIEYVLSAMEGDAYRADSEILCRWKTPTVYEGGPALRFRSDPVTDSAYICTYADLPTGPSGAARIIYRNAASNVTQQDAPITRFDPETWVMTRARVEGDMIRTSTWLDGSAEPTEWQASMTRTNLSDGLVTVGRRFTAGTMYLDWFVVATGGKLAVKP